MRISRILNNRKRIEQKTEKVQKTGKQKRTEKVKLNRKELKEL